MSKLAVSCVVDNDPIFIFGMKILLKKIGFEGIAKLHYHEMEQQCNELLKEEDEKTN